MRTVRLVSSVLRTTVVAVCVLGVVPASAQPPAAAPLVREISLTPSPVGPHADQPPQPLYPGRAADKPERPSALFPLYGSLIALQGLDIHSTSRSLASGAGREMNPAMRPVVQNRAAFIAVKASATAGVIWASEKMWKKNRKAAVIFAALVNSAMAGIVAHNYTVKGKG